MEPFKYRSPYGYGLFYPTLQQTYNQLIFYWKQDSFIHVYTEMSKMECKQNNENALYLTKQKNCCLFLTEKNENTTFRITFFFHIAQCSKHIYCLA